ncbi:hypothetical protein [Halobacterium salinarum]|uniref:hypothetical protein n=1 Tax=Halobacterium salinarum TaxID=2242 RepID=UPI002555111E|nr:hypothetical protein [Halobacterium salinarum]MDL0129128.1 hypothetical protein [Halobacterium salinarum]
MNTDLTIELPDDLEAAIGDRDLSLQQQFLLEYLYKHDIRSVDERCDRNDLRDQLGFNDDQSERVTKALADAGLITIEEYPSKYYYTLDIPTSTPEETSTTPQAVPSNTTNSTRESPEQDANPDAANEQHRTTHDRTRSSPTDSHKTAPPKPSLFAMTTVAITGFLHYLSILPQELALSTFLLVNIMYTTAFALTIHDITPSQLPATIRLSMLSGP